MFVTPSRYIGDQTSAMFGGFVDCELCGIDIVKDEKITLKHTSPHNVWVHTACFDVNYCWQSPVSKSNYVYSSWERSQLLRMGKPFNEVYREKPTVDLEPLAPLLKPKGEKLIDAAIALAAILCLALAIGGALL